MQTMVSAATPHQTSARRCVMVRAMESLMRMSSASVLQARGLYNGSSLHGLFLIGGNGAHGVTRPTTCGFGGAGSPLHAVLFAVSNVRPEDRCCSKSKQKRFAAVDVSQCLLIRRAKELIA